MKPWDIVEHGEHNGKLDQEAFHHLLLGEERLCDRYISFHRDRQGQES